MFCVVITATPPSNTVSGYSATNSNSLLDFEKTYEEKQVYKILKCEQAALFELKKIPLPQMRGCD